MTTYHFGLIGYPIKHSLSPWIHQQFLKKADLDGQYSIIEIQPDQDFRESIAILREMNLDGFNITVPYKQTIIDYLDEMDEAAVQIGAVNTVLCKDGRLIGYNTDGKGYVRSLETKFPELARTKDVPILILGAGGAAKGIYHGLKREGYAPITIANRTIEKAAQICGEQQAITIKEAEETLSRYRVVIQTTSVGMKPNIDQAILSVENLTEDTIASDIVYQPIMTRFLQDAKQKTKMIHTGHTMLLYQAQYAFGIWTNQEPAIGELDKALQNELEG